VNVDVEVEVRNAGEPSGRVLVVSGFLLFALDVHGEPIAQGGAPTMRELLEAWGRSGELQEGLPPEFRDALNEALERAVAQQALLTMPAPRRS